jgi:hypothetical protein
MVSTMVLMAMIRRELEPLADFPIFVKIEMRLIPSRGTRSAWRVVELESLHQG